ncbi:MAG: twin-arginine translocase subunit TatC [Cenarchaeum sp. SB0665_bin_23]|nr:twin-arginine translocase subunit TatC [Cenarchaeum sp. SB0667_bin_13]MXY60774.1 twin-arginine translocase subunit TatC [Cenarchaeum sp. SB0665_bin_23]MXZ93327.1 twin-arginine translocase subunit TatC [Cenarchaeum sp. SB0666_bin_15]MYB46313.1 twin-arginine translocase subunit TatC [Cenarchaeum sp. SB0662_bin_33]MYC79392.1 twin-arginine translocase subunit TatC [Cenarchaeum sp. SB0661_bin_35]MYG32979.1 twin-arginine translocase subunit TatC [Cenarchaeum sp. SB0677_bin_16]MYI51805.1 twin-arg
MSGLDGISDHLEELRKRVIRISISVMAVTIFAMTFHIEPGVLWGLPVYYPLPEPMNNLAAQITNFMSTQLVPPGVELIQTAPGQAFFSQVYIAALLGIVISVPVITRESVAFISPALRQAEIHAGRFITLPALCLFAAGCIFSYVLVVPFILDFLYQYGDSAGLITFLNIMDFVAFVLQFLIAFGLSFQLPLVMYAASYSGVVDVQFWRKNIRYALVAIIVFGAIITPDGSGITMWFVAGPMIALYLAGMLIIERKKRAE